MGYDGMFHKANADCPNDFDSSKVRVSTWMITLVASFKCSLHQNLTSTCFLAYGHIVVYYHDC